MKSGNEENKRQALLQEIDRTAAGVGRRVRLSPAELDEQNLRNKASKILNKIIDNPAVTIKLVLTNRNGQDCPPRLRITAPNIEDLRTAARAVTKHFVCTPSKSNQEKSYFYISFNEGSQLRKAAAKEISNEKNTPANEAIKGSGSQVEKLQKERENAGLNGHQR